MVYQVSDLIFYLNQTLENAYPSVEVEGEVSEMAVSQGKWVYFSLKDKISTIRCFLPVWQMRQPIKDGMKLSIKALPKITDKGYFSLTVQSFRLVGEGDLKKSFEILKDKLTQEGLLDKSRKRLLPAIPVKIAVISSVQAAGYADFIKILDERWSGVQVRVAHVQVQGEVAADQIIRALNYFNQQKDLVEVIAVIRGGGSADDLATFNDEKLARTIASSRVPVVVGVGHETDETLAGLVADVRASTPSNAAQLIVPDKKEIIKYQKIKLKQALISFDKQLVDEKEVINLKLGNVLRYLTKNLDYKLESLAQVKKVIHQINPENILRQGYGILRGKIDLGETIQVELIDKIIRAEVKNVTVKK